MATLHDVAREANVSLATASRVLNGSSRKVAESYRVRVEAAAKKLSYVPNVSAQSVARGSTPLVAITVPDFGDEYFANFVQGVSDAADAEGMLVTIALTEYEPKRYARVVRALRGQRPRGLILASPMKSPEPELNDLFAEVKADGTRVVTFHDQHSQAERLVYMDNVAAARMMADKMIELGYRNAIVINGPETMQASVDRERGFRENFEAGGGKIDKYFTGWFSRELGYDVTQRCLAEGIPKGTLIACMNDFIAVGASTALREDGREVGPDVAVSGFDDMSCARDSTPQITSVSIPLMEIGRQAFRAVVDDEWEMEPLPMRVVLRGSTPYLNAGDSEF